MTEAGSDAEQVGVEELAEETEPEGPDLSSLSADGRALLDSALDVLRAYCPHPGTLSDLPQVTVERQHIPGVCRAMKEDERIGAKMLLCLTAVDYPPGGSGGGHGRGRGEPAEEAAASPGRLEMVYVLQSLEPERTIVLKTEAPYDDPVVPSVTSVWRAADWYEREAHDLFGVAFDGHPDLSPLLLYDGFEGYPGRKEFPFYEYREF
jgi:NADH:ubiquinone oxidoreductase subunit C